MSLFLLLLLLLQVAWSEPGRVKITLLHLNDVYEYNVVDDGRKGSFSRIETLRQQQVARNPNTLFLFAGDTLSPSVASSMFRGRQMIDLWNAVHLDFAVLGNHEFDFGDDVLKERIAESKFTWFASNVTEKSTGRPFANTPPYQIVEVAGVKVGVFGLLTPATADASNASDQVVFRDPIEVAQQLVPLMRSEGAQLIVALTHLTMAEDKALAQKVPVNIILGGHEHEPMQSLVGTTPIFKWGSDARIMGCVDLDVAADSGKIVGMDWSGISVGKSVASDPTIQELIDDLDDQLNSQMDEPVATTSVELDGLKASSRSRESNLGNLVGDAFRTRFGSDVAMILGSSIRLDQKVAKGVVQRRLAMQILPYENPLVEVRASGQQLRLIMEHALSEGGVSDRFVQVSGIQVVYDPKKVAGSRVVSLKVAGQPIEDARSYTLTCNEFMRKGGCGFKILSQLPVLRGAEDAPSESHVLLEYLQAKKNVSPKVEGRITSLAGANSR